MKKLKFLLPLILAVAMALSVPFAVACKKRDKNNGGEETPPAEVTTEILSISVDTSFAKTEYYTGESFNPANVVVNAVVKSSDKAETETKNVTTQAKINSGAYNKNKMGTYAIKVSYAGFNASYNVNVTKAELTFAPAQDFKEIYLVGEQLQNLKEHGTFTLSTQRPGEAAPTKTDVTNNVTIDSSAFDNQKEGKYSLVATYRMPALGAGFTANYPVPTSVHTNVIESREGLNVVLADGVDSTVNLSATVPTATIDPSKIVVKRVDDYGKVIDTPLTSSDYSVELWKENQKVDASYLVGGKYENLTGGVYQLWAYADSLKGNTDYKLSAFAVITVVDEVTSIVVNQNGHTSQEAGLDYLSSKWTYTVNYISGVSKNVTRDDVTLMLFNTKVAGENKTAKVAYTDVNAAGESNTVRVNVNYTITASSLATLPTETFIVKNVANAAEQFATVSPSDEITNNSLFTLTTQSEMKWTEATGTANSPNSTWITNVTLLDGTTVEQFDAGLSQSSTTAVGEDTPSVTFTAKTDITLKTYITLSNASYNSNRVGALKATIKRSNGSTDVKTFPVGAKRSDRNSELNFDLYEGDVLVITITNNGTNTATMWLFGAEATGYKAVGEDN